MNKLKAPKRWLNAVLFYFGCFGAVFHVIALLYGWWVNLGMVTEFWWTWPAPFICILWGIYPPLQLQPERQPDRASATFEV